MEKPKIIIPRHFGKQGYTSNVDVGVDQAIRSHVENHERAGTLQKHDVDEPTDAENSNEYVVHGGEIKFSAEVQEMRKHIPDLLVPRSVDFDTYQKDPFLPVMIKDPQANRGEMKLLLETPEQVERFKRYIENDYKLAYDPKWINTQAELLFNDIDDPAKRLAAFHQDHGPRMGVFIKKIVLFQEYISSPSNRHTSYRIMTSATGDIIAAELLYSHHTKDQDKRIVDKNEWPKGEGAHLFNPKSSVFLNAKDVRSNMAQGGGSIILEPSHTSKPINDAEREILKAHGLDTQHPIIPETIRRQASIIGKTTGRNKSLYVGIDFIQDARGHYYWLETNASPGPGTFIDAFHYGQDISTADAVVLVHKKVVDMIVSKKTT